MIVTDKEQIKKRQQIFNLKTLLFTENTTSKKLKSKITELKSIFKLIKKIIKEKINQIELNKNDRTQSELKKQVCNEINKIIILYNDKNNFLICDKNKERKIIREKINQMKLSLKEMKYYELKDIKDLIVQIIQEKKDSYAQILSHLKDQKDIFFLFQQNNLYDFKMISFEGDKKLEEKISKLKTKFNHNKKFLKKEGEKVLIKLEDELENEKLIFNKYIEDKGFHFKFNNNHYKEQYDIEIEAVNKTNYSSDSSSSSDNSENDNSILLRGLSLNEMDGLIKTEEKESLKTHNLGGCIITKSLCEGTSKLKWIFREEGVNPADNGWRAIGDTDTEEYINTPGNNMVVDFDRLVEIEPAVLAIYDMPVGTDLEFDSQRRAFIDSNTGKEYR